MCGLARNLSWQSLLQIVNIMIPLLLTPYLSRVLGIKNLGIFSYTQSIVSIFLLFAMLGVSTYGTRTIAKAKKDRQNLSYIFWNIYGIQFISSFLSIVAYCIFLLYFVSENREIALFQGLFILSALIDVSWFYFGVERIYHFVKINIFTRILTFLSIFIFVKCPTDLWVYVCFLPLGTFFANILMFVKLKTYINLNFMTCLDVHQLIKNIKPNLYLFFPILAMSVFHIMDKTMLGSLSSFEEAGAYHNSDKIINIPFSLIVGLGTVILPAITKLLGSGERDRANLYFMYSIEWILIMASAMTFGIAAISCTFVPWFFGDGYEHCILITIFLAPVILIKSLSYIIRMAYLIPFFKEKIFMESVVFGACVNCIMNLFLIPKYGALGAVAGTLLAEISSLLWLLKRISNFLDVKEFIRNLFVYVFLGVLMGFVVYFSKWFGASFVGIFIQILVGVICYVTLVYIYFFFFKKDYIKLVSAFFYKK